MTTIQSETLRFILELEDEKKGKPVEATFFMPEGDRSEEEIFRLRPLVRFSKREIAELEEWIVVCTQFLGNWRDVSHLYRDSSIHLQFSSGVNNRVFYTLTYSRLNGVIHVTMRSLQKLSKRDKLDLLNAVHEIVTE